MEPQMTLEKLEQTKEELRKLRTKYDIIQNLIIKRQKEYDALEREVFAEKFKDVNWLINNPHRAGAYEAFREWLKEKSYFFEREFGPVRNTGYYMSSNQIAVEFDISKKDQIPTVKRFLEETLPIFKPSESRRVLFNVGVGEQDGICYLGYDVDSKRWLTVILRYGGWREPIYYNDLDSALHAVYHICRELR
jgi:hypothetical protein